MNCRLETAIDGHIVPVIEDNGEKHLGSVVDGEYAAKVWCDHNLRVDDSILVLVGMGDLHIAYEASTRMKERVVVYEPSRDIFEKMNASPLFDRLIKDKHVIITCDESSLNAQIARICNDEALDCTSFFVHPGYEGDMFSESIDRISQTMNLYIDSLTRTRATIYGVLDHIILNELRNIVLMKGSILLSRLKRIWDKSVPIIIVGAGPSLKKNVSELKKVGDRACIICMDTAVTTLENAGIKPHILATIDVEKYIEVFGDIHSLDMPIAATANSRADVLNEAPGDRIWCYEHHVFSKAIRDEIEKDGPQFPIPEGVSGLSISIPIELGTKRIIFVGQDLAYSSEGKSHSDVREVEYVKDDAYLMDGYNGGKVYSKEDWSIMKRQIEETISSYSDRTYINATEGGVKIKGTKQQPLSNVVKDLPESDGEWKKCLSDESVRISDDEYDKLIKRFDQEVNAIEKIKKLGYDKVFYDPDYKRPPIFDLLLIVMRSREERSRKERFDIAISVLEDYIRSVKEDVKNGWFKDISVECF